MKVTFHSYLAVSYIKSSLTIRELQQSTIIFLVYVTEGETIARIFSLTFSPEHTFRLGVVMIPCNLPGYSADHHGNFARSFCVDS